MKLFASLLFLAAFAVAVPVHGQDPTADDLYSISGIKRPTASPTPAGAAKTAPGPKKPLDAMLCKDKDGKSAAMTFAPSETVYLHYMNDSATKGDKLRVSWVAEDAAGLSKNKKLTENTQVMPGPGVAGNFYLPPAAGGFPVGKYHVDLYNGDKLAKSLKFTVKK